MASDYLLELEGIKGESKDKKLPGLIEVESFSWGQSNIGSMHGGGGGGAGKVAFQDLHFTTTVNKASADIAFSCASGKHITKAVLHVRKQGGEQAEFYTVTLQDVLVSSYQSGGHGGAGALPSDQFALNFAKIKFEYKVQDEQGVTKPAGTFGWDIKANAKW